MANIGRSIACPQCEGAGEIGDATGKQLRKARLRAKIGLREMAGRIGLSPAYLSEVETGKANVTPRVVRLYQGELR